MPYTPLAGLGPSQLPQLSASGLARLTESYKGESNDLYDPENPGDASDEEENLVIDDQKEDAATCHNKILVKILMLFLTLKFHNLILVIKQILQKTLKLQLTRSRLKLLVLH